LLGDGDRQIASLRTVGVLDEPTASRRPRVRPAVLSTQQERQRQPECTTSRARAVARRDMRVIEAFEELLELEIATGQIRGRRQTVEIVDVERRGMIREQQRVVGVTPGAALVTRTTVSKMIHLTYVTAEPMR
jgi:hypothetical protein